MFSSLDASLHTDGRARRAHILGKPIETAVAYNQNVCSRSVDLPRRLERQRMKRGALRRVAACFHAASVGAKNTRLPRGLRPKAADAWLLTNCEVMPMS